MHAAKRWNVAIEIDEHDGTPRAVARSTRARPSRPAQASPASARENQDVPEIGDELAITRALAVRT